MAKKTINIKGRLLSLDEPCVMAIINATTDSFAFSCGNISEATVLSFAAQALAQGADILDIGGCSTRPGSAPVSEEEEWRRVQIALKAIRGAYADAIVSVDTFRPQIARRAVELFQADIINDISGGTDEMFATVAELNVPYILTHNAPLVEDKPVSVQVLDFLVRKAEQLHRVGVKDVILDPGFGFNKTLEQNYELLGHLEDLQLAQLPVLAGLSRKSMFYKLWDVSSTSDDALVGTIAANMVALAKGADILRVHDVRETVRTVAIYNKTK